jgi:8-oxo-dGTP diphosphatase
MLQPTVSLELVMFKIVAGQLCVYLQRSQVGVEELCLPRVMVDVEHDRNIDSAVRRGISGLVDSAPRYIEQIKTIGNATRYPQEWMIAVVHVALFAECDASRQADWYPCGNLGEHYHLSFDHHAVVNSCVKRLRSKAQYTSLPLHLAAPEFSLSDAQRVYEMLLSAKLEKKSFRRRLLDSDIVLPLNKERRSHARPAQLFKLKPAHIIHHFRRNMLGKHKDIVK